MYSNIFPSFASSFASPPQLQQQPSVGYVQKTDISYDTSSRDPVALRARVFVGNLNTSRVTREDVIQLFKAYGTLAGVTLFKGYAFVQYSNSAEADLSVSALNGYNWNGSILDVKLAVPGAKPNNTLGDFSSSKSDTDFTGVKRIRLEQMNELNKTYAESLTSIPECTTHDETPDTLICGGCRFVCNRLSDFIEHRKRPCSIYKAEGEPTKLQCIKCLDEFPDSWNLILHWSSVHKTSLFKESSSMDELQETGEELIAEDGNVPTKVEENE